MPLRFEDNTAFIEASPNYISDDGWKYEVKYTVADVIHLRRLILSESYSQEELDEWDLNEDGKLTVADIVCLRSKIMLGD